MNGHGVAMGAYGILAIGLVATAALIAMACLLSMAAFLPPPKTRAQSLFTSGPPGTVFLFDGERLIDATPTALAFLHSDEAGSPWLRLRARLDPMFPDLSPQLDGLEATGRIVLTSDKAVQPALMLRAEFLQGITRLTLIDSASDAAHPEGDGLAEIAQRQELEQLRALLAHAPLPIWSERAGGGVFWANRAYLSEVAAGLQPGQELQWPLPALFPAVAPDTDNPDSVTMERGSSAGASAGGAKMDKANPGAAKFRTTYRGDANQDAANRVKLETTNDLKWFDLHASAAETPSDHYCYALPADRLVKAEQSLRDFTQTLAKTFAHLPIGLAVFDQRRALHMFNPALMELTGLPVDFLIARPSMAALLDAMRERSMLPEPRDYRSWRRQLSDIESQASTGVFQETWSLPSGRTYRATGRPHPNGALAFMLEDISTEITRTLRYRADLELGQAVIDALGDAVVVFGQDGSLSMANAAAGKLWGAAELDAAMTRPGALSLVALWRQKTAPTLLWGDLETFIGQFGPRDAWEGELRMGDGRLLACRAAPLPHGATLVTFHLAPAEASDAIGSRAILIA